MPPVNAPDSTGGEKADPGHGGGSHGGGNRRRSDIAPDDGRPEVARTHFDGPGRHPLEVRGAQTNPHLSVEHGHGCRCAPFVPDRGFAFERRAEVVGRREALPDDRGFERDHRAAGGHCVRDLARHLERHAQLGLAPVRVTASAATTTARSAASTGVAPCSHATQKAAAKASPAPVPSTSWTAGAGMTRPNTLQPAAPSLITGTCARCSGGTPIVAT